MTFLPLFSIPDALGTSGLGFLLVLAVLAVIMLFVRLLSKVLGGNSKKEKSIENSILLFESGDDLPSRAVSSQVLSAC